MSAPAIQVDGAEVRDVLEFYARQQWTDGLPVVPVTQSYLDEFLTTTSRAPDEVLFPMPHLNRELTVRLAAINAAMAGCLPEYFPVVVAAWDAFSAPGRPPARGIWQSTTGTAPLVIINGPVRDAIGVNYQGSVFGSGFRANATIGRSIRLTAINVFGLHPHLLDQATQGTLGKYAACIGEYEEASPFDPLHVELGLAPGDSAVTALTIRSCMHIEARHTSVPEQLALDLADTVARTGTLVLETSGALVVLCPEHAELFGRHGWSKDDIRQSIMAAAVHTRAELAAVGKDAVSRRTRWRLPGDHPDAIGDTASAGPTPDVIPVLSAPSALQIMVAGASNAGVSTVIDTFGYNAAPPPTAKVEDLP